MVGRILGKTITGFVLLIVFINLQGQAEGATMTFKINPSVGSLTMSGTTYSHGQTGSYASGSYPITANVPADYKFVWWEVSGGIGTPNGYINPTTISVTGDGYIKAVLAAKVTLYTNPSNVGSISWGSCSNAGKSNGEIVWYAGFPPDDPSPTDTVCANVPSGYTFAGWNATGGLSVSNTASSSTIITYTGPGTITANFQSQTPSTGTITVNTNLASASFAITGPSTYSGSGTAWSTTSAPAGTYTITYGAVAGYNTPSSLTTTLTSGASITFIGTYTSQPATTGTITVNTNLASASFTITGPSTYSGTGTSWSTTSAPAGTYTITYGAVTGYNTPSSLTTTLTSGASITFIGTYIITPTPPPTTSLEEAVDNTGLTFSTGGNANWFGQTTTTYYGGDAAQSGYISNSQNSWIQTTVTGAGTLRFYWKVSSEPNYDFLEFYIDGSKRDSISGNVDWQQKSYSISSGSHILQWKYIKDGSVSAGSDAGWIDKIEFTGTAPSPTGTINVNTNLTSASFIITGPSTYSGTGTSWSTTSAPAGTYTITYGAVTGYNTPSSLTATLASGASITFIGTYIITPTPPPATSLEEAVDNTGLTFSTGGNANWFGQTTTTYYGGDAAQSGHISDSQNSWIQTTVTGAGTLRFYWKVSSEPNYDFLEFYIDGSKQDSISGNVDWQQKSYSISSGSHTLQWKYIKDGSVSAGSDAGWIDKVEFMSTSPTVTPTPSPTVTPTPTITPTTTTQPSGMPGSSFDNPITISKEGSVGGELTEGELIYYKIWLNKGKHVTLTLNKFNLDIYLYNPNRQQVNFSKGDTQLAKIEYNTGNAAGYYYIKIVDLRSSYISYRKFSLDVDIGTPLPPTIIEETQPTDELGTYSLEPSTPGGEVMSGSIGKIKIFGSSSSSKYRIEIELDTPVVRLYDIEGRRMGNYMYPLELQDAVLLFSYNESIYINIDNIAFYDANGNQVEQFGGLPSSLLTDFLSGIFDWGIGIIIKLPIPENTIQNLFPQSKEELVPDIFSDDIFHDLSSIIIDPKRPGVKKTIINITKISEGTPVDNKIYLYVKVKSARNILSVPSNANPPTIVGTKYIDDI